MVAYSPHGDDARDVTIRYLRNRTLPGKTKGFRIPPEDVPVYDISGQKMDSYRVDWFAGVLSAYQRKPRENWSQAEIAEADELERWMEGEGEGVPDKKKGAEDENITTISGYKNHPTLVLERHLKRDEAVIPGRTPTTTLTTGKGSAKVTENVYQRSDIAVCKTAENWYREEGLTIKSGEQPLKQVKRRAATLTRKREIEAQLREGETAMQGMYARHQTEPYVPPPVVDGKVLTNAFGNIDVYVPSMVPEGGVHVPLKGAGRVAKKLGISYAEAVTGFEFHMQRAVPVVEGVVVARENEGLVKDAWRQEEEERKRREDGKRIVEALGRWRRFLLKLRVLGRLREEWTETHGEEEEEREEINPFVRRDVRTDSGGGGFVPDQGQEPGGDDEELEPGGFFLEDDEEEVQEPGGFMLVDEDEEAEDPAATFTASAGGFILDIEEDKPADKRPIKDLPKGKEVIRSPYFSQNPLRKKKPNIATTTVEPPPPMANSPRTRRTLESVTITNREKPSAAGGEKGTPKRSGRAVKSRYLDSGPKEVDEELDE